MSPFGAAGKRQTSFAAVEVIPLMEETEAIEIPENDIRVDVFRSSGPGGQSVNTTDSAVRITHLPTGTVVSMQNEKSQIQNRAAAMRVLASRLLILQKEQEAATKKELAGTITASWGDQMRSYVLAPYQMVKDLRTDYEVSKPDDVFDGDLDGFIAAGIRWRKSREGLAASSPAARPAGSAVAPRRASQRAPTGRRVNSRPSISEIDPSRRASRREPRGRDRRRSPNARRPHGSSPDIPKRSQHRRDDSSVASARTDRARSAVEMPGTAAIRAQDDELAQGEAVRFQQAGHLELGAHARA